MFAAKVDKLILVGDLAKPLSKKISVVICAEHLRRMISLIPIGGWPQRRLGPLGMDK